MGTIFLDEIGDISNEMQLKLLRVLQEREIRRIGDDKVLHVDVRILAASNKNLYEEMIQGRFRSDLYYRLSVLELSIPPLRFRREDIPLIIDSLMVEEAIENQSVSKTILPSVKKYLSTMEWPGNVRQLKNAIQRLYIMDDDNIIDESDMNNLFLNSYLYKNSLDTYKPLELPNKSRHKSLSLTEMKLIVKVLQEERNNKKATAARLQISTTTLWRKIKEIEQIAPGLLDIVRF